MIIKESSKEVFQKEKAKKYPAYRITFLSNNLELAEVNRHLYGTNNTRSQSTLRWRSYSFLII